LAITAPTCRQSSCFSSSSPPWHLQQGLAVGMTKLEE